MNASPAASGTVGFGRPGGAGGGRRGPLGTTARPSVGTEAPTQLTQHGACQSQRPIPSEPGPSPQPGLRRICGRPAGPSLCLPPHQPPPGPQAPDPGSGESTVAHSGCEGCACHAASEGASRSCPGAAWPRAPGVLCSALAADGGARGERAERSDVSAPGTVHFLPGRGAAFLPGLPWRALAARQRPPEEAVTSAAASPPWPLQQLPLASPCRGSRRREREGLGRQSARRLAARCSLPTRPEGGRKERGDPAAAWGEAGCQARLCSCRPAPRDPGPQT